ncbi:hypothetical protein HDV04_001080 [Boothiomyces sp. JEL0838]|nr:hypothetical protein HDV04_001080 [Boothiomyces sp. JEL0838]
MEWNVDAVTFYYMGNFNVSITGIHSFMASLLFEQFKNLVMTQVKKPTPIKPISDKETKVQAPTFPLQIN